MWYAFAFLLGAFLMFIVWRAVSRADEGKRPNGPTVAALHPELEKDWDEMLTLLRRQGEQMTELDTKVATVQQDALDNKAALDALTVKVDAALVLLANLRETGVSSATLAALDAIDATLKGATAQANDEAAKVDAATEPPVAPTA